MGQIAMWTAFLLIYLGVAVLTTVALIAAAAMNSLSRGDGADGLAGVEQSSGHDGSGNRTG